MSRIQGLHVPSCPKCGWLVDMSGCGCHGGPTFPLCEPGVYRGWSVDFDPPPIPTRVFDWSATHPDYDGAEDANDDRHLHAASLKSIKAEIDAWIASAEA